MNGVRWLERILNTVADRGRELIGLRDDAGQAPLDDLCRRLISGRGEASNIALAREILNRFEALDATGKNLFFATLADNFGPDPGEIQAAAQAFRKDQPDTLVTLIRAVEPPRQELFRRLNMAPSGTAGLVQMRAELLQRLPDTPELAAVDADFRHLLASWFNRGFLRLERIDWHSPAAVLERLMHHESVHPIAGWQDLQRRLAEDRRCFGFFHPALPEQPLIFVEIALTQGIAGEIAPLIDPDAPALDPERADTATFFSINNALLGLRGISFGNFLLKQVLTELQTELPALQHFVTLSPMPRFADTLQRLLRDGLGDWTPTRINAVLSEFQPLLLQHTRSDDPRTAILQLLASDKEQDRELLNTPLSRLALLYLVELKNGQTCMDPVAAFHLANGAILERINSFADLSDDGLRRSYSVMVNYRYDPDQVVANHEAFIREGRIAMSRELRREHEKHISGVV